MSSPPVKRGRVVGNRASWPPSFKLVDHELEPLVVVDGMDADLAATLPRTLACLTLTSKEPRKSSIEA